MRKSLLKFHYVLWIIAFVALVIGYIKINQTSDFNVHDTYYVIATIQLYIGVAIYFGAVGFLYWLFYKASKKTIRWLDVIYIVFMFLGIISLITIPLFDMKNVYYTNTSIVSTENAAILIAVAQLILIINFVCTLFRKRSRQ